MTVTVWRLLYRRTTSEFDDEVTAENYLIIGDAKDTTKLPTTRVPFISNQCGERKIIKVHLKEYLPFRALDTISLNCLGFCYCLKVLV